MTADQRAYLELFSPDTYGLEIPRTLAKEMEALGWIEWVPPQFGTRMYRITPKGEAAYQLDRDERS